jgi:hypothetical protein
MEGRAEPGGRGDVDDGTAAALGHRVQDELGGEHDRPQVQVERVLPFRRLRHREARLLDAPGVVDQHVDRSGRVQRRAYAALGGDVCVQERTADPFGPYWSGPVVEVSDDHLHALGRQPFRDPATDPVRAAGHQGGPTVEFHHGIVGRGPDNSAAPVR